jgi:pseudaminic acid cytidylyltransferase
MRPNPLNQMHTVAIIPARGGSKRIPLKNIKVFAGKPMIAHSIQTLQGTGVFDRIIVSTDSDQVARVAQQYGAEVPFIRPRELADDHTPTSPVLAHAVESLQAAGYTVDYFCCLYAAAPMAHPEYIRQGFDLIREKKVTSVFSVTSFPFPIFRALKMTESGHLQMFWPEHELTRSQDLPHAYHDAGQFYWLETKTFLERQRIYASDAMPVILPRHLVQDIDTPEDWQRAELMYEALQSSEGKKKT